MKVLFRSLFNFNYSDINYAWSSEKLNRVGNVNLFVQKSKQGFIKRLALYFFKMLTSFFLIFKRNKNSKTLGKDVLVYFGSLNQYKSLKCLLHRKDILTISESIDCNYRFPLFFSYLISFVLSPLFILYLRKQSSSYFFNSLKYNLDGYLLSIGYYVVWKIILKKNNFKFVVMSNDHNPSNRALTLACKELDIKTIFIQHAPAVDGFPMLDFSYAFLEGQYSANTYKKSKLCKIRLVGSSITDNIDQLNQHSDGIKIIGVSSGLISDLDEIENFISVIHRDYKVILRPHPADPRFSRWKDISVKYNSVFSSPIDESPKCFLDKINVLVGPMSGLLLEAAVNSKIVFCYNGKSDVPDWYALIENNICIQIDSALEMIDILNDNSLKEIRLKSFLAANHYYHLDKTNTCYSERVNELITRIKNGY
jgi:hypothetical protein